MDKLNGKKYKFMVLSPGETIDINSYNTHQWSVIEKYTRKGLLINKEKVFSPQPNEPSTRTILIIGRSGMYVQSAEIFCFTLISLFTQ